MRRFYLIALLLVGSLTLVGFLAWQAHVAVRSHRGGARFVFELPAAGPESAAGVGDPQ